MILTRGLARSLLLALFLVAAATLSAALATLHWFLELFSHFTPYYLGVALLLAALARALGLNRHAGVALGLVAANAALIASVFVPPMLPAPAAAGTRLTIFHFNVGIRHPDPARVVSYILANAERYDVVVLIEAGNAWQREIEKLRPAFPHMLHSLDDTPFDLAVLTKAKPAAAALVEAPAGYTRAELRLASESGDRPVTLYAVHPPPPISPAFAAARNASLAHLAQSVAGGPGAAIVVGDLNLTPYSPHFKRFAGAAGVTPARAHAVARPTWPTPLANARLGVPIDHILVSPDIALVSHEIGPDLASDHLPVIVTVALPGRRRP